ncbi:MAG TPA: thiamine phosphate synthase [bacterium]|nr:thiamine phosphate synthase [bacterium]
MARLYAIVGSMERARLMLEAHVPYLQLRFKAQPLLPHREEIRDWIRRYPNTRMVINDDLEEAQAVGAWGVHLGQEDVRRYTPEQLRHARVQVGISTHNDEEIGHAWQLGASLVGFGPIFATSTKAMEHAPQGVERLREVVASAGLPVIAIGGITAENMGPVAATGVSLIAMISFLDRLTSVEDLRRLMARMGHGMIPRGDAAEWED